MEPKVLITLIATLLVMLFLFAVAIRAIYMAFFKKKDERSKWIVIQSMAHSFIILVALQFIQFILKWTLNDRYDLLWKNFTDAYYFEPWFLSFIILGIVLLINTKRSGGSL